MYLSLHVPVITCTSHYMYLSLHVPVITCTCHYMYLPLHAPVITCTCHYMYMSLHVPVITCTCHYMYLSLQVPVITCTWHYMYLALHVPGITCTWHYMYLALHVPVICNYYLHVVSVLAPPPRMAGPPPGFTVAPSKWKLHSDTTPHSETSSHAGNQSDWWSEHCDTYLGYAKGPPTTPSEGTLESHQSSLFPLTFWWSMVYTNSTCT